MDSAGIPWYSTGKVNVTQGSSNVAGVGTNWVNAGLKVGDIFTIDKSRLYQITAVNSNTSLTLQEAYQGATGTSQVYFVIRNFAGTMQAQIAAQVSELVNKYESYIDTELKQIIGPAGPTSFPYRGTWATGRSYNGLDVVQYGNQLYMALYGHTSTSANAPGATGTAWTPLSITASGDIITTTFGNGAGFHNSIFRGKNLGSSVTAAQWAAIGAGTFDDLWIGDYWNIGGVTWRIADFDYWLHSGDQQCTKHHAVIVPDTTLYNAQMNETNTTAGAYIGSTMYTANLEEARSKVKSAFGTAHIMTYREPFANAVANGKPSAGAWANASIELMKEPMFYGSVILGADTDGTETIPYIYHVSKSQLNLFRLRHDLMIATNRMWYWLQDVVSASRFAICDTSGFTCPASASSSGGVRPAFPICA